jgi:hypothetical protein
MYLIYIYIYTTPNVQNIHAGQVSGVLCGSKKEKRGRWNIYNDWYALRIWLSLTCFKVKKKNKR